MNWNKPILTGWQASPTADFIRRHRWFFKSIIRMDFFSFYTLFLVYVPLAVVLLLVKYEAIELIFFVFTIAHFLTQQILVAAALERG